MSDRVMVVGAVFLLAAVIAIYHLMTRNEEGSHQLSPATAAHRLQ